MLAMQILTTLLGSMLGLEIEHSYIRNERFQLFAHHLYRPVARTHVDLHQKRSQQWRLQHSRIGSNIGVEHIHAMQQFFVLLWLLWILIAFSPVVHHHLVVGLDGKKSVGVYLMRMQGQVVLHMLDGPPQVAYLYISAYR